MMFAGRCMAKRFLSLPGYVFAPLQQVMPPPQCMDTTHQGDDADD
ncbi:hypothetical protein PQR67_25485 [Paraburkholderia fungorum]